MSLNEEKLLEKMQLTPIKETASEVTETNEKVVLKSEIMWDTLKNTKLDLFSIPNQKLSDYCDPINVEPDKLFLKLKPTKKTATAIISALSKALYPTYNVEQTDSLFIITEV